MHFGVVVFPGSNCDRDTQHALDGVMGQSVRTVWHTETSLDNLDCVILPGGFSYGDHLRSGAIARFSPIMGAVERFAANGGLVWGICNGFQILVEAGLLPGAMLQNRGIRFVCRWTNVRVESDRAALTRELTPGTILRLPVAHHEGSYFVPESELARLEASGQIILRYCEPNGSVTDAANPNGSMSNIAGVCNQEGNVFGLMPHPERCAETLLGGVDGRRLFESVIGSPDRAPVGAATNHDGMGVAGR